MKERGDLEVIRRLEKNLGEKLVEKTGKKLMSDLENGYSLDAGGRVVGLNLDLGKDVDLSLLRDLPFLSALSLRECSLVDVSPLGALTSLTELNLEMNQVVDVSPLGALTSLTFLNLISNQVVDVLPLETLTQLRTLDLSYNKIKTLPLWVCNFKWEIKWNAFVSGLCLEDNPLETPPVEVVKRGRAAVQAYFDDLGQDAVPLQQAKLLFVGGGEVGKTTLMRTLTEPGFQLTAEQIGNETTTHGINIKPWELTARLEGDTHGERTLTLHAWDFGGQDIYFSTHQFFLTKRSLYILVWEARREEETNPFDYWLNVIKLLGGNSPVIVVMNKADERTKPIDEATYRENFQNIRSFHKVSCLHRTGIDDLHRAVRQALAPMPHLKDLLPKTWIAIRDKLRGIKKDYITAGSYYTICNSFGLDTQRADHLSNYLHNLGAILRFRTDPLLEEMVVLNPEWVTKAVYRLIDTPEIIENKGRFQYDDLQHIWDPHRYPKDKYPELVQLMEKFELCFNFTGTRTYTVPELAPGERPRSAAGYFRSAGALRFRYSYTFMPRGIVSRLIARNYYLIREENFWKNGVEFSFEESTALVSGGAPGRELNIAARGPQKKELLSIIRKELDHIHQTLNMKKEEEPYKEEVPCNCSCCLEAEAPYLFPFAAVKKAAEKNIGLRCYKSFEPVSPGLLLQGYEPPISRDSIGRALIACAMQLQGKSLSIHRGEDNYTGVLALLLNARGFIAHEQTLWGRSESGGNPGEIDLKIDTPGGKTSAIAEAFLLSYLNRNVISSHLEKIFGYDPHGLHENFILVYVRSKNFGGLWKKYVAYLKDVEYPFSLKGQPEPQETKSADIKSVRTTHSRHGTAISLTHLFINMPERTTPAP